MSDLANKLFYGDNLEVLRGFPPECVDLVYIDPPFNSSRLYNVMMEDEQGNESEAQARSFKDTWAWGDEAERTYAYLTNTHENLGVVPDTVSTVISALRSVLTDGRPLAPYLTAMTARLVHLHRVLKPTGSLYVHCDPTASHYLKIVLDALFGPSNFRNEVVWKRSSAHSDGKQGRRQYGRVHDVLLFYTKGPTWTWNVQHTDYDASYVRRFYRHKEPGTGRLYRLGDLTGPGGEAKGNPSYEVLGITRYWRYSRAHMDELIDQGRVVQTKPGAVPAFKRYLDEMPGVPLQDLWTDISPVSASARERQGWDTQKPLALLARIIKSSSNPGDVLLDAYCGCGTALEAAQQLGRRWIGIDHTYPAVRVMRDRMQKRFPDLGPIPIENYPTELDGVRSMAAGPDGRYQFQWWALDQLGALSGVRKKGADGGVDGRILFLDGRKAPEAILISAKSGHVEVKDVRELIGKMHAEAATLAVLFTLEEPTQPMRREAAGAGRFRSKVTGVDYPRVLIYTAAQAIARQRPDLPASFQGQFFPDLAPTPKAKAPARRRAPATRPRANPAEPAESPLAAELREAHRRRTATEAEAAQAREIRPGRPVGRDVTR